VSIDDEEMSNEEDWDTVDHLDGYSATTPRAQLKDLGALTATPDSMSECSMRTAIGERGNLMAQSNSTSTLVTRIPGVSGPESHAKAHTLPTLQREPLKSSGHTAVYDNINANITLTEGEPHKLLSDALCTSMASSGSMAPNQSVYGHLSPEELDDVFDDVNGHPNDMIVDGLRRLNDKYIVLRKVGEVCKAGSICFSLKYVL
jgi:hypothetical protein